MLTKQTLHWVRIVAKEWPLTIAVPLANLILIIIFWQSQLLHYGSSTQGVLFMWLTAGLIFALAQMSLQVSALREALHKHAATQDSHVAIWSLVAQLGLFGVIVVYNTIALGYLAYLGVAPTKPLDLVIAGIIVLTVLGIWIRYRSYRKPTARLMLATGTKAAPQWLQACNLAIAGSSGLAPLTMIAQLSMGVLRYVLTRHSLRELEIPATICANKAAFRDVVSIGVMCIGFIIGRL